MVHALRHNNSIREIADMGGSNKMVYKKNKRISFLAVILILAMLFTENHLMMFSEVMIGKVMAAEGAVGETAKVNVFEIRNQKEFAAYSNQYKAVPASYVSNHPAYSNAESLANAFDDATDTFYGINTGVWKSTDPTKITVTFASTEILDRVIYAARMNSGNKGYATVAKIYASQTDSGEDFVLAATASSVVSGNIMEFKFTPTAFKRLRFEFADCYNACPSASLLHFYREDRVLNKMDALFSNKEHTALNDQYRTPEAVNAFEADIRGELDSHVFRDYLNGQIVAAKKLANNELGHYSVLNAPSFYGTTSIRIPLNTNFNADDARFRIFATDFEDGDLTNSISLTDSNVNTAKAGTYSIGYSVTDSHGNRAEIDVPVTVKGDGTTSMVIQRTLYTIKSVRNMDAAGMNRGNYHDRQNLGIYMPEGTSFKIKQVNTAYKSNLNLNLFADDSAKESAYTVPADGTPVTVTAAKPGLIWDADYPAESKNLNMVPFMKSAYDGNIYPVVEIEFENSVKALDYYHDGDNQAAFMAGWTASKAGYSVIETERATFLLPLKDKDNTLRTGTIINVNNYRKFTTFDDALAWYNEFLEEYDSYTGLEINTNDWMNQNVRTKYFVKANIHGAGLAYYSGDHTAFNGNSIRDYFVKDWMTLHELGHGYGGVLQSSGMDIGEVVNNVLGHYQEMKYLEYGQTGWLGNLSNKSKEAEFIRERNGDLKFDSLGFGSKLYVFVNLLNTIGPEEGWSALHTGVRKEACSGDDVNACNAIARYLSSYSGKNVIPYLNAWALEPDDKTTSEVYESDYPMLYFIRDLVNTDEKAVEISNALGRKGMYALAAPAELSSFGLRGNATVTVSIDDISQIMGKYCVVKNGSETAAEVRITEEMIQADTGNLKLSFKNLPIGAYELEMPTPKSGAYEYGYKYILVKEGQDTPDSFTYRKMTTSPLSGDEQILFRGYANTFANMTIDYHTMNLHISSADCKPHTLFDSQTFASIEVLDESGKQVYVKNYIANVNAPEEIDVKFKVGYKINITHLEGAAKLNFISRSTLEDVSAFFLPKNRIVNSYRITGYGLAKLADSEDAVYSSYLNKVKNYTAFVMGNMNEEQAVNKKSCFVFKNKLLAALNLLKEADKAAMMEENRQLFSGSIPVISNHASESIVVETGNALNLIDWAKRNITVTDIEDGAVELHADNFAFSGVPVDALGNAVTAGSYTAVYTVSDSDGNQVSGTREVRITAKESSKEEKIDDFIRRLYNKVLGRTAGDDEIGFYRRNLVDRISTGADVGRGFVFSPEFLGRNLSNGAYVEMLYETFMGRASDAGGKAYWTDFLDKGVSRLWVFRGFVESVEFTDICSSYGIDRGSVAVTDPADQNPNLAMYIYRLYAEVLDREAEAGGLSYYAREIQEGRMTPVQAAQNFIFSPEFQKKNLTDSDYVKVLYRTFMGREYDQGGLEYHLNRMNNQTSRQEIMFGFADSPEFRKIIESFGLKN